MSMLRSAVPAALAVTALAALLVTAAGAAPRVVLFEEATNYGCPPCATANPIIHQVLEGFGDDVAAIKWHVWWPNAGDPFYNHNPVPVEQRIGYYGINGAPDVVVGGINGPDPHSASSLTAAINNRLAVPSPLAIQCSGIAQVSGVAELSIDVTVETPQAPADHRLFVELVEQHIHLPSPNGETDHYDVFRHANASNNATGEPIDLGTAGTQHFDYTMAIDPAYQDTELGVRAWVQDYTTHDVVQAGKASLVVPYLVAMTLTGPHTQIGGASETVSFAGEVTNLGAWNDVFDVTVSGVPATWSYSYTTPAGTFSGPSALPLDAGASAAITIDVDSQGNPGTADMSITATSQGNPDKSASISFRKLNGAQVLLVDDDLGETREEMIGSELDAAGVSWGSWDTQWGALTIDDLHHAAASLVWATGAASPALDAADRALLGAYMDGGGKLLLTGQEIAYELADPSSPYFSPETIVWFVTYLHANYVSGDAGQFFMDGVAGDPIGDGLSFGLEPSGPNGQTSTDVITPAFDASGVMLYRDAPGWHGTTRWTDGTTQLVFMTFGIEGIVQIIERNELMSRILDWLGVTSVGVAEPLPAAAAPGVALLQNAPNPFRPSTTISYRLAAGGPVRLRVYDVGGRLVRNLVDGVQRAARHDVTWNGDDDAGRPAASGIYFYRLEAAGRVETHRMVLAR